MEPRAGLAAAERMHPEREECKASTLPVWHQILLQHGPGFFLLACEAACLHIVIFICALRRPGWCFELEKYAGTNYSINLEDFRCPSKVVRPLLEVLAGRRLQEDTDVIKVFPEVQGWVGAGKTS